MKITLPDGKVVIAIELELPDSGKCLFNIRHITKTDGRRATQVYFERPDYFDMTSEAACSFKDNFCKRTGRKIAAERLIKELRSCYSLSKADRTELFKALCPEFYRTKTNKRKKKNES